MPDHALRKGLDIPIAGQASGEAISLDTPGTVAYCPTEFRGIVPRLNVREGDEVERGAPLFHSKSTPQMQFLSPVTGRVKEIRRGHRRVITDIVVEVADADAPGLQFPSVDLNDAEAIRSALLERGQWAALRTRPLNNIPRPDATPQAIVVCGTETGPLMPGADVLISGDDAAALATGLKALAKLAAVHLTLPKGSPLAASAGPATAHTFSGPHPAGDAQVQVNLLCPPRGTGEVWYCSAWDVVEMGKVLSGGSFPNQRVYAAVGAGVAQPRFVKTITGAPMAHLVGSVAGDEHRWIRGSVLTGEAVEADRWVSHFKRAVHVLPDTVESEVLGWALPMFGVWSFYRAYLKGFTGTSAPVDMRPGIYGGIRAMVPIGVYKRVMISPDILPEFLFKSIVANDLEESIQLGLLDMTDEEAALCTYICPSKIEFDELLKQGLAMYEKEAS